MKVKRIILWRVPLTSHLVYCMSDDKTCNTVDTIVARIDTDAGISGWGEVCPIPHYLPAYSDGVAPAVAEMAPVLLGAEAVGAEQMMARLDAHLPGHGYAKSALDIALWDILGKTANLPLFALLGGRQTADLPLYYSITCIAPEEMARIAKEMAARGFLQFQVKLGADRNWQADAARLRLVREAVGDEALVYGDWNCGASRLHAIRVGRAVAGGDFMLEQPCATLADCAAVRTTTGLPMKIDESAHDTESLLRAHALGCMDAVAIKTSKFGGLGKARSARDLCLYLGAQMCIEDTWGSDVATAAALHLAAASPPRAVLNVCNLSGYVTPRLDAAAPSGKNGRIAPPTAPGLGVAPDAENLGAPLAIYE